MDIFWDHFEHKYSVMKDDNLGELILIIDHSTGKFYYNMKLRDGTLVTLKRPAFIYEATDEYTIQKDSDGWELIFEMNHGTGQFCYKTKTPDGYYFDDVSKDIYTAIDKLNQEKENYKI